MGGSACRIRSLLAIGLLVCWAGVAAGAVAGTELDEIAVVGKSLRKLQREIIAAEDRFFRRFNLLNTRDEFDVRCGNEKITGTLVPQRQCRIQFLVEAGAFSSQEFHRGLLLGSGIGIHAPMPVLQREWALRRDEYQQLVRGLVEKDPELRALAGEWGQLLLDLEHRNRK